eukprot:3989994-Pleurochrysis_carterae.AAC.1
MGFGGAYAPNRFERISTLVAAWVQAKQAIFDAEHPLPAEARAWQARRERAQREGRLPAGSEQTAP